MIVRAAGAALSIFTLVLLASCASPMRVTADAERGTWRSAPSMNHARAAHAVVASGDAVYAIAGTGVNGAPVLEVERFDGTAWRDVTRLPGNGLNAPAAAIVDGRIYVVGGFNTVTNVPSDRVLVYDTARDTWSQAAPLPSPRGGHALAVLAGRIHTFGGGNSQSTLADHDVYDPKLDRWSTLAPLPRSEGSPAAVSFRDRIYLIGGRSGPSDFGDVDIYDSRTDTWTSGPPMQPRGTSGAVLYCGTIHVFGGESQARRASLGEVLKLVNDSAWQALTSMPTPRNFSRAVVFQGNVLVVGGSPTPEPSHASQGSAVVERFSAPCAP